MYVFIHTHTLSYNCTRDTPSATWVTKEAYLILPHGVFARKVSWLSSTYEKMIMEETVNLMLYILSMNKQIKHTPPKTTHGTSKCWFPKKGISFSRGGETILRWTFRRSFSGVVKETHPSNMNQHEDLNMVSIRTFRSGFPLWEKNTTPLQGGPWADRYKWSDIGLL